MDVSLVSSDARLPLYQRVRDVCLARMVSGHWGPDTALPPEEDLAAEFQVAVGTVRKALEGLVASGHLERRQGRGTFVRRPAFRNALARFFRMTDANGDPLSPQSRILSRRRGGAHGSAAERLGLATGAATIEMFRIRVVNRVPILAEEIVLPAEPFAALLEIQTEAFGDLLYPLYESACCKMVASAKEIIRFGSASEAVASALGLSGGAAVAIIERVAFGLDERPLEFRRSYGPAERFSYTIDIR